MNDREQVIGKLIATMMELGSPAEVLKIIARHLYSVGDDDGAPEVIRAAESVHKAQIILELSVLRQEEQMRRTGIDIPRPMVTTGN